ncbi:hypothetical protein [Absidia glauca]|uniref:Ndc10 domain-containing protein n=1 Tax=Absidia glauca TaxID=4829 RepID=A0A168P3R5_ABSGL|nr:hypothetical protein [Absidia glauca]
MEIQCPGIKRHRNGFTPHRDSIGKALSSPGIRFIKKTHINCGSAARMAGNVCANVDQIRRQGRWNNTTINGAYLTNLPKKMVQSMAGFPTYGRFFYLAHAVLNSPTSLSKELSPGNPVPPTIAENAIVQVIMMFRKTFIQTSVLVMELHPCYPIWQHPIFSDPAYLSFKRDMLQIEVQEHDPAHTLLQQCVPMHFRFRTPIGYKISFLPVLLSCSFFPSSLLFFASIVILLTPRRRTNERTSKRTNER